MAKPWLLLKILWAALCSRSNQAFYDRISGIYDAVFVTHRVHAETITRVLSECFAGKEQETFVLDLGCGTGMLTTMLADRGYVVIGADVSFESLRVLAHRDARSFLVQADAQRLPMADGSCHSVVCLGVWRHFDDPEKVLNEVGRVLVQDGSLVIGYFPPAIAGTIHVDPGAFGRVLAWLYRSVTSKLGYTDRADFTLEQETLAATREHFGVVRKITSGSRWHLITAQCPTRPKATT